MTSSTYTGRDILCRNRQVVGLHNVKHIEMGTKTTSDNTGKRIVHVSDQTGLTVLRKFYIYGM